MLKYLLSVTIVSVWFIGCGSNDCCSGDTPVDPKGQVIQKIAPTALISTQGRECIEGGTITMDGRSSTDQDGHVQKYEWLVDGKLISQGPKPTFSCDSLGEKEVCLKVTDDDNLTSSVTCQSYVVSAAPKIPPVAVILNAPDFCTCLLYTSPSPRD